MKLGANDVSAVKIGATDVNKVYLGSNLVWEAGGALLLDDYPDAEVAYSLRKLRNAYAGDAIEVRRTVGTPSNTEIGFVDDELDTASLLSFVGSGSGFISTWYDQSGNTNTQAQSSASAQPNTVDSGTLVTLNGNPTGRFGFNRFMQTSSAVSLGSPSEMWIFTVLNLDDVNTYNWIYGCSAASNNNGGFNFYVGGGDLFVGIQGATYVQLKTPITTGNKLISVRMRGGQTTANAVEVYIDSELATLTPTHSGTSNATFSDFIHKLGARENNLFRYIGDISEFLIKTGDQSANRAGIESNINSYYNMYWDGSQDGLLDDYSNASAAYSLRALSSSYTGPAIRVTTTGSDFKDIGLLYDGSLDTASLLTFAGGGDVFVTTWYDQSGEGNDVAQGSQSAQPQIVSSGVVVTTSDNYAIDFSGSTKTLVNATFDNSTQVSSVFTIAKSTSSAVQIITDGVNSASRQVSGYYAGSPSVFAIYKGVTIKSTVPINTNINLLSTFFDVNSDLYLNGVQILNSVNAGSHTREGFTLGSGINVAGPFEGSIFEVIVFDEQNKASDRVGIETNINNYYDVY